MHCSCRRPRFELGYLLSEVNAAQLFFQLVSRRYDRSSMLVMSNLQPKPIDQPRSALDVVRGSDPDGAWSVIGPRVRNALWRHLRPPRLDVVFERAGKCCRTLPRYARRVLRSGGNGLSELYLRPELVSDFKELVASGY